MWHHKEQGCCFSQTSPSVLQRETNCITPFLPAGRAEIQRPGGTFPKFFESLWAGRERCPLCDSVILPKSNLLPSFSVHESLSWLTQKNCYVNTAQVRSVLVYSHINRIWWELQLENKCGADPKAPALTLPMLPLINTMSLKQQSSFIICRSWDIKIIADLKWTILTQVIPPGLEFL